MAKAGGNDMLKAISFDGNGVLYYRDNVGGDLICEYIKANYLPDLDLKASVAKYEKLSVLCMRNDLSKRQMLEEHLNYIGLSDQRARENVIAKEIEFSRAIHLYPNERETILELNKMGIKMGMITNTVQTGEEKAMWFRQLGLDCVVEEVVSSIDIGISKPDPGIYQEYIRRVGFEPGEIAYVAHDEIELIGAHQVGMVTISFNYNGDFKADYNLVLFKDLLDIPILPS